MEEMQIVRHRLLSLQVCAPGESTDQAIEKFANETVPTGIESKWTIRREGHPDLGGDPERQPCLERCGCVHIVLDC